MNKANKADNELFSIADLAREFEISTRTIRFYEAKSLIAPERVGSTRVFRKRDRARLILILRGKRLGFSLREIQEYLSLYEVDGTQSAQVSKLSQLVDSRLGMLEQQMVDLQTTISELRAIKQLATAQLSNGQSQSV